MNKSESIKNLTKALLTAQSKMGAAVKGSKNPFFKSNYSDYNSVLEVVKDPLNEAGLIVLQPTVVRDGKTLVETTILHAETGEFISGEMEVVCAKQNDPQAYGSAITYMRRYSLQAMLSIPSEDSDGEGAMNRATQKQAPALQQTKTAEPVSTPTMGGITTSTEILKEPKKAGSFRVNKPTPEPKVIDTASDWE
jgi:hypothetical protein